MNTGIADEVEKEEEPFGLGCALEFFSEHEEIFQMVDNLKNVIHCQQSVVERAYERFSFILGQYQEQPHLIDSHIGQILNKLIEIVRNPENNLHLKHAAFKYMYVIVNVRGYKIVVRHLPHEVADFEPVLQLIQSQDPNDAETWTTRYVLILWLSIIVMIPFHMSRLDGTNKEGDYQRSTMERVFDVCKTYAIVPDKCRDAAAYLSSKYLTRVDVKEQYLSSFLEWACELSSQKDSNIFVKYGTLACIAAILKHGKREDLLLYAQNLLQWIINTDLKSNNGANIQKLVYKIIQRIGMTFLPARVASWRYKRGNRSLAANLSAGDGTVKPQSTSVVEEIKEDDEDVDVPDEIEEVVDQLIQGLGSTDSIVRWSAAKGVGRITGRLPKDLADEVVGSVLDIFTRLEKDSAWHGGCLALAELGRRGLLLPQRLPEVVPIVLKALVYDEPRGYSSVGSHIRDAACYVCWSFARAYETEVLKPFVQDIASTLLIVACFDKEINCRRAASAAFQENVGRQGTFPHGIEILTAADFYAVSVRNNAYLNISVFIAQFEEYTLPLIEHLIQRKVDHWDTSIRELTAKALYNLTYKYPDYMINTALPLLFQKSLTIDLNSRHGSVLGIGEIARALSEVAKSKDVNLKDFIGPELLSNYENLIGIFQERMYFRGLGGELMKQACSSFIENCSLAKLPLHNKQVISTWLQFLNSCLSYDVPKIRAAAINALNPFLTEYYQDTSEVTSAVRTRIINDYISELLSVSLEVVRMGHALALGSLPKFMLQGHLEKVVSSLVKSTIITHETLKWAESRRDATKALCSVCVTMAEEIGKELNDSILDDVYECCFNGLKEYTQDNRGDIGAWMRESSMTTLQTLTLLLNKHYRQYLSPELMSKVINGVVQQATEKIDRTRALAGRVFYTLIYSEEVIPNIPNHGDLTAIFPKKECDILNWNYEADTFPRFVQLIQFPVYTYSLLLGMVSSVGGLTESLVKNASSSLFAYLKREEEQKGPAEIIRICQVIYKIFCDYQKIDRISVPMLRFLDKFMSSGCISSIISDPKSDFPRKILKLIQVEITGCKDIYKLIDGINLLCQFVQIKSDVCNTALVQLSILLCHRQTYVRRSTSTKLYESLLVYGDNSVIPPENLDEVMNLLSITNWEDPVETVKPVRNDLCKLMGIRVPVPKKKE